MTEGRTISRWGPVGSFFPPTEELSPSVAAYLIRADEIRTLHRAYSDALEMRDTLERTHLLFLLLRFGTIAIDDAGMIINDICSKSRFAEVVATESWASRVLSEEREALAQTKHAWGHVRNRVAGHLEVDLLRRALASEAERLVDSITIADHSLDRRWQVLLGLQGVTLHRKEGRGLDIDKLRPILNAVMRGEAAVLAIEGVVVWAYDQLTGGSLLRVR